MNEDHDQRLKSLLQPFFADFLELFFADWAKRVDAREVVWLEQEVFANPPSGDRKVLDLVARVPLREQPPDWPDGLDGEWLMLMHVEIESPEAATSIRRRMPYYYMQLREKYQLPVTPIVLFLKVGLDGIGTDVVEEKLWDLTPLRFTYLYVGLPGLNAEDYVNDRNWLGVALATLMKIPKDHVVELGRRALSLIARAPLDEQRRFLLANHVEAYLPLDSEQKLQLEMRLAATADVEFQAMNKTTYDRGVEKGVTIGIEKGERLGIEKGVTIGIEQGERLGIEKGTSLGKTEALQKSILRIYLLRFGTMPAELTTLVNTQTDPATLEDWLIFLATANSIEEWKQKVMT
jgi:hypothetical protein